MRHEMKITKKNENKQSPLKCVFHYLISFQKERERGKNQCNKVDFAFLYM
jgi:hypothetical protein